MAERDPKSPPPAETSSQSSSEPNPSTINGGELEAAGADSPPSADDRISSLPDDILVCIISRLPLKEAISTSILSPRWRHLWTLASLDIHLEVNADVGLGGSKSRSSRRRRIHRVALLTNILHRHRGPIRSFRLSPALWKYLLDSCHYDSLLQIIVQGGTQDLAIGYKLPPELLTCESLRSLDLVGCKHTERILALPPNLTELKLGPRPLTTGGFQNKLPPGIFACHSLCSLELERYYFDDPLDKPLPRNLRELMLRDCILAGRFLSHVPSVCQFLDVLHLEGSGYFGDLCISSLSLRKLVLNVGNGMMKNESFVIMDAPNLEILLIERDMCLSIDTKIINAPKLCVLGSVDVSMLESRNKCFQNGPIASFGAWVHSLKKLALEVILLEASQVNAIAELLKWFPCLEDLYIMFVLFSFYDYVDEGFWEKECSSDFYDRRLKMVNLKGLQRIPDHLGLARYFVRNARQLKVISILCNYGEKEEIKHELVLDNRASSDLQVIFECCHHENYKFSTLKYLS